MASPNEYYCKQGSSLRRLHAPLLQGARYSLPCGRTLKFGGGGGGGGGLNSVQQCAI